MPTSDNRRIAKNTIFLYFRMIVTMLVTLYTTRVVLATLGADDYGIYNVIGGVVVLFGFLNTAMSRATQRFLSFELGKGENGDFRSVFSMSINCHLILGAIFLLIFETVGLWFVNTQMNIPEDRFNAALWVYQFSIFTTITQVIRVPYGASVIAHEKMSFYAYISIFEVISNLAIAFLIVWSPYDKLIVYAALKFFISLATNFIYYRYCFSRFEGCHYSWIWDNQLFRKLVSFSGWSMLGGGSVLVTQNGSNILINIFQGVAVNAGYGIANQVSSAIYGFVSNFQLAFQPQIVKLYAEGKVEEQTKLVNRASIISYFLLLIINVPFLLHADFVLSLWLKEVPSYAVEFCQWMLIYCLIDSIQAPLWMAINATGNIKNYTIWSCSLTIINLPIAWILLYLGYSPIWVFVVRVIINFITAVVRIIYVKSFMDFPSKVYLREVLSKPVPVTILSLFISYGVAQLLDFSLMTSFLSIVFSLITTSLLIVYLGLSSIERSYLISSIRHKIKS